MQNFDGEIFLNGKLVSKGAEKIILLGVGFEDMKSLCISRAEYFITIICVKHFR
jgi:hypothetical protein